MNGSIVKEPGIRVKTTDKVQCFGEAVEPQPQVTAVLNKPIGYETTLARVGSRSISDLIIDLPPGTVPVGRLDINTGGLLLLSNDGELVYRLTHPSWKVEREYLLKLKTPPSEISLGMLRKGVFIGRGEFSRPDKVYRSGSNLRIALHTGRNREVRRLAEKCCLELRGLERIRYGPVVLGNLERGSWRVLEYPELRSLKASVGITDP